jgi:amidohydrolase
MPDTEKEFTMENLLKEALAMQDWLIDTRRTLHRIPEPGNEEIKTSQAICAQLDALGIPYTRIGTGVVGLLEGARSGRCIALRADMDALPIEEPKDRPYASQHPGYMHACGHDAHMTIALGAAKLLARRRHEFSGSVKFLFQPAEETTGGAKPMIEAGCLENPHVDFVLGLHVIPELPAGQIEVKPGPFYGASDNLEIRIKGKSSHAAYPEQGIDAIVAASAVVQTLQTIVSRSISALDSAVITIGKIQGGTRSNIIASEVVLTGTIRTLSEQVRKFIGASVEEVCARTAAAYGASSEVHISPSYPVLVNDEAATEFVRQTAIQVLGAPNVHLRQKPTLGVEDFAYYLRERPGAFWHLGCGKRPPLAADSVGSISAGATAALHSPDFDIDESCLPIGVALQASTAMRWLLDI